MKKLVTLFVLMTFAVGTFAQMEQYFDFENGYQDTAWNVFSNGTPFGDTANWDISVVENPFADEVNSSDSVLSFYVRPESDTWVGMYTDYDVLTEFTEEAHTLAMMVWKPMISRTGLKVERSLNNYPGDQGVQTIYTSNTKTEEWELLLYDFTVCIGYYFERLTMFPEFPTEDDPPRDYLPATIYVDNIGVPREDNTSVTEHNGVEMMLYPTPATYRMGVVYPGMTAITLSDIMGRQIRTLHFPVTDSKVIETGDLATGIYFVTADIQNGDRVTMRFMKK